MNKKKEWNSEKGGIKKWKIRKEEIVGSEGKWKREMVEKGEEREKWKRNCGKRNKN